MKHNAKIHSKNVFKNNPHKKGTPEHKAWHHGADAAADEHIGSLDEDVELEEGAFSSGALKPSQKALDTISKTPSSGTVRGKDDKGVYTSKTVNGKEVSRTYEKDVKEETDSQFAQRMKKQAEQPPTMGMSNAEKVDKGWRNPNIPSEQIYKVVALTKSNALAKPTKMKVKADSIEDLFSRLAANDWYPLEINGVEVIAGRRLKQGVAEGTGNIGSSIKKLYQKIYRAGDDEIEYFYHDSPVFAQYWDEYEGDLDSIIAEVDPADRKKVYAGSVP